MSEFSALWADLAAAKIEREDDYAAQAAEDTAQGEDAWLDYVLTFRRERQLWAVLVELGESLAPVSSPAPKRSAVRRFVSLFTRKA